MSEKALYLCDKKKDCNKSSSCINGLCMYTTDPNHAIKEPEIEFDIWVPVEEKLPEEEELYLVTVVGPGPNNKNTDVALFVMDNGYIDNHWDTDIEWIEGDENDWHVTAWMPYPEPYEKEDK